MALINVKKDNRVLTIDERELDRYLSEGYEQVKYDGRSGNYKTVQKKTVNDAEFADEITPQAAERDALNPTTHVEFGAEISPLEAAKLGGTPADVAAAAGDSQPVVEHNGSVTSPAGAHEMEFAGELTPDASPAPTQNAAAAAANDAANAAGTEAQYGAEFGGELTPNADYTTEAEQAAAQKTRRKRNQ